jgi:hypothetical protein
VVNPEGIWIIPSEDRKGLDGMGAAYAGSIQFRTEFVVDCNWSGCIKGVKLVVWLWGFCRADQDLFRGGSLCHADVSQETSYEKAAAILDSTRSREWFDAGLDSGACDLHNRYELRGVVLRCGNGFF